MNLKTNKLAKQFKLLDFQQAERGRLISGFRTIRKTGKLLIAPTGTGKTFYVVSELKDAQDEALISGGVKRPSDKFASILILTKKSVKIQTNRVARLAGLSNFYVDSYDALRSSFGELVFLEWKTEMVKGFPTLVPYWTPEQKPDVIWCDECQVIKNPDSLAGQVILAAIKQGIPVIFSSATPFVKISEAEAVVKGLRIVPADDPYNRAWNDLASDLSGARKPFELNHEAIKRLNDLLEEKELIVRFHNIKYKHKAINKQKIIPFEKEEHRLAYEAAFDEYQEARAKADMHTLEGLAAVFVAMLKFRQVAEMLRVGILARLAAESINKGDRQIIIASNFVPTLRAIWEHLTKTHGINPDKISFLYGGVTNEQERQKQIDKFQSGKSDIFLCTLKAGGVGISLHHEKESAKPRIVFLPPTWSAYELVQMLGRAHRINSLSTTYQFIVWFEDTIEEQVAERVAAKIKCLKEIVTKKETWVDLFNQPHKSNSTALIRAEDANKKCLDNTHRIASDPNDIEVETIEISPLAKKMQEEQVEIDDEGEEVEVSSELEIESEIEKEAGSNNSGRDNMLY